MNPRQQYLSKRSVSSPNVPFVSSTRALTPTRSRQLWRHDLLGILDLPKMTELLIFPHFHMSGIVSWTRVPIFTTIADENDGDYCL